ncbi:MAG: metalloregulator ArsR/SmtB family transcription factor [Actinomycetota bacterium]
MTEPVGIDQVFDALADPTRRLLLERLATGQTVTASSMAGELPMSRQAVSKHLVQLDRAGLVATERVGREVRYAFRAGPLVEATRWMVEVGDAWDGRLGRLARLLDPSEVATAPDR